MRLWLLIGIVFIIVPLGMAENFKLIQISEHPQLFLDDYVIADMTNIKREINQPVKHPSNPLIVQDLPWEKRLIATYGTVFYDPQFDKFRCWYTAGEHKDGIPDNPEHPKTAEYFICYAESCDGINWSKPMVGREVFGTHKKHNIVVPQGHGWCVVPTPDDPDPKKRYKGAGGPWFGFSPDGLRWNTHNWRDSVTKNDTSTSVVNWNDEYLAFVRYQVKDDANWPGAVMRGTGLCISKDFENWTKKELIFTTDDEDGYPWTQVYGLPVTPYGDQLIGVLWLLHLDKIKGNNSLGDEDTQLVVSRDGKNWKRVADRATFLEPTPGTWDQGRIHAPTTSMFVKDDLIYIYYSSSDTRHGSGSWGVAGIGLATLPADRFVALKQSDSKTAGIIETKYFSFIGDELLINTDADKNDLQVELLNKTGAVLSGFERENTQLIRRDKLRYKVVWQKDGNEKTLKDLKNKQPLAIRFILRNCSSLYAFQIKQKSSSKKECKVQELILEGNPYERGVKHGKKFKEEIRSSIDKFKHESADQDILLAVDKTIEFLDKKFPEINEEIKGISKGAKVPFKDVFLFNNRAIVQVLNQEDCSGIVVFNNGVTVAGHNKDRRSPLPGYDKYFLKKVYPERGYAFISYGHIGRIWGHGMNEAGLCTVGTAARPLNYKGEVPSFGSYLLPPVLLSKCKNVSEALNLIEQIKPICDSGNFLLCDSSGKMVVVEITPEKRVIRKSDNNQIFASTFFASGQIEHSNDLAHLEESKQRFKTIRGVLSQKDSMGFDMVKKILRTHRDKGPVCRHPDSGVSTVLSWIALPKQQEFYFLEGLPCENEYQLYTLKR